MLDTSSRLDLYGDRRSNLLVLTVLVYVRIYMILCNYYILNVSFGTKLSWECTSEEKLGVGPALMEPSGTEAQSNAPVQGRERCAVRRS